METLAFIWDNLASIARMTGEHVEIVGVGVGLAITVNERLAKIVLYVAAIIMTIPSVALFLYSQLPIVRNTYTAITNIDPALREAARGMGMTTGARLRKVELPIALPIIMAGVRMAVVINVGIAAIAAYIGAGGLGKLISRGISQSDPRQLIADAILVSVLAIAADIGLSWVQRLPHAQGPSRSFPRGRSRAAPRRHDRLSQTNRTRAINHDQALQPSAAARFTGERSRSSPTNFPRST
ncbi:choline ABC transporter permease [Caballeronia ptereochthonis]|uniref:Choline ABC transporter permease n=1 Tax=Caballeronia ptereochthonis TaxID=1777144 RepID=A0A158C0L4_9BURK|nr:choline ABC transporter permease [Caballeronia ptereochthonis]